MGCLKNPITKFIFKILFSHVGLCFLVCGYIVGGAYLFRWIEGAGEEQRYVDVYFQAQNISLERENLIDEIVDYCNRHSRDNKNASVAELTRLLQTYHDKVIKLKNATHDWGRQAYKGDDNIQPNYGWEITSAILFTATIMTTIGYGHIAPVTDTGYMVCIIYSVFAIPLLSMFVLNITGLLSTGIRLLYHRGICCHLERRRDREHAAMHAADGTPFESSRYRTAPEDFYGKHKSAWQASAERGNDHRHESDLTRFRPENLVPASLAIIFWVLYWMGGAILFQFTEDGWTMVESFYYITVTLLTIGFGDIVPGLKHNGSAKGQMQYGLVSIYIVVGLAMTGSVTRLGFDAAKEHMGRGKRLLAEKTEALRQARKRLNRDDLYDKDDRYDHVSMTPFTTH